MGVNMKRVLFLLAIAIMLLKTSAFASDAEVTMEDLAGEIKALKSRIVELEGKLAKQDTKIHTDLWPS